MTWGVDEVGEVKEKGVNSELAEEECREVRHGRVTEQWGLDPNTWWVSWLA